MVSSGAHDLSVYSEITDNNNATYKLGTMWTILH